jgi:hypothetical protein
MTGKMNEAAKTGISRHESGQLQDFCDSQDAEDLHNSDHSGITIVTIVRYDGDITIRHAILQGG